MAPYILLGETPVQISCTFSSEAVNLEQNISCAAICPWGYKLSQSFQYPQVLPLLANFTGFIYCTKLNGQNFVYSNDKNTGPIVAGVVGALLLIFCILATFFFIRRRRVRHASNRLWGTAETLRLENLLVQKMEKTFALAFAGKFSLDALTQSVEKFASLEAPRRSLKPERIIGQGHGGEVYLGSMGPGKQQMAIAIKMSKTDGRQNLSSKGPSWTDELLAGEEALQLEARLLHQLQHPHIVRVLAIVTQTLPTWICLEYMAGGDLKTYLRQCRPALKVRRQEVTAEDFKMVLGQIASALAYLEQHRVVHRDVAARNVLVGADLRTVKLSDLGATRVLDEQDYYRKRSHSVVPLKWMAPETIRDAKYTTASDVWAFGVLCYEVTSFALTPYGNMNPADLLAELDRGFRLPQPPACPLDLCVIR
jgi:hypothetical protein